MVLPLLALPALALPVLAIAQEATDPPKLGYDSAVETHRGLDDEPLPSDGDPMVDPAEAEFATDAGAESGDSAAEPAVAAAEPGTAPGAKPAGEMPMPVDPDATGRPGSGDGTPADSEPPRSARALEFDSVLDDYTPYEESDGPNWVESNGTVGEIGGWRTYARELYESSLDEGDGE